MPQGLSPATVAPVALRPDLWATAIGAGLELAPNRWWTRRPFLPLPDSGWLRFRLETAYGGTGESVIPGQDLVTWLEWKKEFPT